MELIDYKIKSAEKLYGKDVKFLVMEILSLERMLTPEPKEVKQPKLIPLADWNDYHIYPTVGALRQYKHYNTDNFHNVLEFGGLKGGKILINEDKLFEWLENRKNKKAS